MKPNPTEFQRVVREHQDRVYRICCYYLGKPEDAEDAAQETLVRLWRHWDSLGEETRAEWISTVARNLCLDALRKRKKEFQNTVVLEDSEEILADPSPGVNEVLADQDEHRFLMNAIRELEEPIRSVILLREIEEMPYSDIAKTLSIPLNSIRVYLFRGRRILRDKLKRRMSHEQAPL
jgi:RNA polymerase sigma-70 factor (ECF subfamily)